MRQGYYDCTDTTSEDRDDDPDTEEGDIDEGHDDTDKSETKALGHRHTMGDTKNPYADNNYVDEHTKKPMMPDTS